MLNKNLNKILILDFGSQYTQLIARRIRALGVYSEIYLFDVDPQKIRAFEPAGIILSGGPESVYASHHTRAPDCVFTLGCPVLGICYGMQTMAKQLGGMVSAHTHKEFGEMAVKILHPSVLTQNLTAETQVWMSHGDQVTQLPAGFITLAESQNTPIALCGDLARHFYGVQFHPEVTHTQEGQILLHNFVRTICQCPNTWTPDSMIHNALLKIQSQVGTDQVLLGLSGGVDSSVLALLLHKAIPTQLHCIFVDTGLLRQDEGDQVMQAFSQFGLSIERIQASERFYTALKGVIDPEQKRKIIGRVFIEVFDAASQKHPNIQWLAQGTIYPDVIESAGKASGGKGHVIKSHHNVGGLPDHMKLQVLEPLRMLFKDEVRAMGLALGLPTSLIQRHPFPGPGLGVRILGEVTPDYAQRLRQADAIFLEVLRAHHWYDRVSQAFAVYLPVKSVGVKGDQRAYEDVIALRAVQTTDFMTAHFAELPHALLREASHRIVNEVPHISRVVYDITGKPPATIEWE